MINIMDWFLSKMRLVDEKDEYDEPDEEMVLIEKPRIELMHRRKDKESKADGCVYFKKVQSYDDCKQVIDNYKSGAICVYCLNPASNPDAQGMMNYICGGLYVLGGETNLVGENVYVAIAGDSKE